MLIITVKPAHALNIESCK